MVLLRESSEALGEAADLAAAVGRGDGGITHGEALVHFAEAATRGTDELPKLREELVAAIGWDAFVEAAATVGIFNGLVRTADAIGIPLDDGTRNASAGFRDELGLVEYGGAAQTNLAAPQTGPASKTVEKLFDF